MSTGEDEPGTVELIDADSTPIATENTVSKGPGSTPWLLAVGAVLAAVVGWAALSPAESAAPEPDSTEAATDTTFEATTVPATTAMPNSRDEEDAGADQTPGTGTTGPGTPGSVWLEERRLAEGSAAEPLSAVLVGGPIGETGVSLVGGNPLSFLDLDTGDVIDTNLRNYRPLAVVDNRLIAVAPLADNHLVAIDLSDLAAEPEPFESTNSYLFAFATGDDPSTVVAIGDVVGSSPWPVRFVYDSRTGELIDQQSVDAEVDLYSAFWYSTGEFTTPRAGGVYRTDGDSFQLVGPGRVVAQGSGVLLVEECDAELSCSLRWRDSETYGEIDLPIPDDILSGEVLAGGRLLRYETGIDWRTSLFDLENGMFVAEDLSGDGAIVVSVSDDDRLVTYGREGSHYVFDIATGIEYRVTFEGGFNDGYSNMPSAMLLDTSLLG